MYSVKDMGRFRDTMGASPAILATTAAVTVASMFTGVLGLWPGDTAEDSTAPALAPQAGAVDSPEAISARSAPAREVILELLGDQARWGAVVPVGFGCALPAPVLSAERDGVSVHVFGPGLGGTVAGQVADCGDATRVAGADATTIWADAGRVTAWTRGDVLVTVSSSGAPGDAAAALDERLVAALDGVCADLDPSRDDARRNPTQGGYAAYTEQVAVRLDPAPGAPDVGPAPAQPAAPDPGRPTMPSGLAGPALPDPLERPAAPAWPGAQPLQVDVTVPAVDRTGPGCGWSFTGAVAPAVDQAAVRARTTQLTSEARTQLKAQQDAWLVAATAYAPALAAYTTAAAAWDAHVDLVTAVTTSWAQQAGDLADYQLALAAYDKAVADMTAFLAERDAAQKAYDAAVAQCETEGDEVVPEPGARPTPTGCPTPPQRPAILDQPAPTVPVKPTPPDLWQPGDPVLEASAPAHP